jgi:L-threonylcarbamoyladenylate synthase
MIEEAINRKPIHVKKMGSIKFPGSLESHYSPKAKVLINVLPKAGEGFIALSNVPTPTDSIRLGSPKNIEEFARCLYSSLRSGDHLDLDCISVITPEGDGIELAIKDRVERSSY